MENNIKPESRPQASPLLRLILGLVVGLVLLIPLWTVLANVQLAPAQETYAQSQTDNGGLREGRDVGLENYERLAEDERFVSAISFSQELMNGRIAAVAIVPVVIGLLIGIQGLAGRVLNRLLLGLLTVISAPTIYFLLWRLYWMPLWGKEPSPVYPPPDDILLASREGARNALLQLDSTITLAIALVALVAVYAAVVRGWRRGRVWAAVQAGVGAWLISLGIAAFSGFFPDVRAAFYLTRGGPAIATTNYMMYMYQSGFQFFRIGYGAAQASYLIGAALLLAAGVWLVTVVFRLRLSFTPAPRGVHRLSSVLSILTIPAVLLLLYPVINLILWGNGQAAGSGFDLESLPLDWSQAQNNTLASLGVIWLIQIPTTYLAGMALGFVRPLGRIVSNILFLPLLMLAFIPAEGLIFAWFLDAREVGMLDTVEWLSVPWLVSGVALLIFKLFFDGAHERYMQARQQDDTAATSAFLFRVFLPSLLIVLLVGVMMSFISLQDLLWPLLIGVSADVSTIPTALARLMGMLGTQTDALTGAVMAFFGLLALFAVPFALLQVLVVDRLALLGGKQDFSVYDDTESSSHHDSVIQLEE